MKQSRVIYRTPHLPSLRWDQHQTRLGWLMPIHSSLSNWRCPPCCSCWLVVHSSLGPEFCRCLLDLHEMPCQPLVAIWQDLVILPQHHLHSHWTLACHSFLVATWDLGRNKTTNQKQRIKWEGLWICVMLACVCSLTHVCTLLSTVGCVFFLDSSTSSVPGHACYLLETGVRSWHASRWVSAWTLITAQLVGTDFVGWCLPCVPGLPCSMFMCWICRNPVWECLPWLVSPKPLIRLMAGSSCDDNSCGHNPV